MYQSCTDEAWNAETCACLQIVLLLLDIYIYIYIYYYAPSLRCCWALCGVHGCPLAIMQSSLPLWSLEHSGPMTLCACLESLVSLCCTTCVWWEQIHVYKYGDHHVPACTKAALTRRGTPKHAHVCRLYYYAPSLRCCWALCGVHGCPLAIMQSSLPLWSLEHSGPMTLCACLESLVSLCCTTCVWWEQIHVYKYGDHHVPACTKAALTRRRTPKHAHVCRLYYI